MAITVFLSLYTTRLIISHLGVEDFGIYNLVGGATAMLAFLNSGMSATTQRYISHAEGSKNGTRIAGIFHASLILHTTIAFLVFGILELASYPLFNHTFSIPISRIEAAWTIYQFAIITVVVSIITAPYDAIITARENMSYFAIAGVIESGIKAVIAFQIGTIYSDKLIYFGLYCTALSLGLGIAKAAYCHKNYPECAFAPKKHLSVRVFKELSGFAGWSLTGSSTSMISNYGQGIIINMFYGPIINAAHGIANQVSGQLGSFAQTLLRAISPTITKSEGSGNRNAMIMASILGTKLCFFLLMIFYIPVFIEMPYIFSIWLQSPPPFAIVLCRLQLIRNLIEQLFITLPTSISASGSIRSFQITTSIINILPIALSYAICRAQSRPYIPHLIYIGYSILSAAATIKYAKASCGIKAFPYIKNVVIRCTAAFMSSLGIAFIPVIIFHDGPFRLISVIAASVCSYSVSIWVFGLNIEERSIFKSLLHETIQQFKSSYRILLKNSSIYTKYWNN